MHTYVDDFIRWMYRTFLNRDWHWPVTAAGEPGSGGAEETDGRGDPMTLEHGESEPAAVGAGRDAG